MAGHGRSKRTGQLPSRAAPGCVLLRDESKHGYEGDRLAERVGESPRSQADERRAEPAQDVRKAVRVVREKAGECSADAGKEVEQPDDKIGGRR